MMPFSRWTPNRFISAVLYIGFLALAVWGGIRVVNYSLDSKFYKDFLVKWEVSSQAFKQASSGWPAFDGSNHAAYMERLIHAMKTMQIAVPRSNTRYAYRYVMDKIGPGNTRCDIFVLCLPSRIILYDLPRQTLERLDRFIDGVWQPGRGRFQGKRNKDNHLYTGVLYM